MKTTTQDQQAALQTLEYAIVDRMCASTGYNRSQMVSMIRRIPELGQFYLDLRAKVIGGMVA